MAALLDFGSLMTGRLVANRIQRVTGIINGTCNYILTRMAREQKPFKEILGEAQALGFEFSQVNLAMK